MRVCCKGKFNFCLDIKSLVILLADRTLPEPFLAVQLEVGLEVPALSVATVVTPGRHTDPLEGQGTP